MLLRFHPEARAEFRIANLELHGPFVDVAEELLERMLQTPNAGALWPGVDSSLGVRRRNVRRYRYLSVAYTRIGETLWIIALVHERKRSGYWLDRLDDLAK